VLGQLIADLTGTSFAQAATRLVREPLGMADSWFPAEPPVSPDAAYGYVLDEEDSLEREEPQVFTLQSAGGLWSTGPDLGTRWRRQVSAGGCGARWMPPARPGSGQAGRPR
jgi:CubicO group peptidase (beta-lactamase class C family)